MGAARDRGTEGGTAGGGADHGAPLVAGGEGDGRSGSAGAAKQFWARIPCLRVAAQLSTPGQSQPEPGEKSAVARLLAAAGWMRDLRGTGGGQRLSTPGNGSPSRGARLRWPWPPTLTT